MSEDDRQLVIKCRAMQEPAYRDLMRRYEAYIYRLCYSMTGNREDALDLTQETFFKIFRGLDSYNLNRPFKPWLRRVAVNTCVSHLQNNSRSPLFLDQPLADGNITLADTIPGRADPVREYEWQETSWFLKQAIDRLPGEYRLLIVLRHQEEMTYQEIADETGIPLGTVKTHLFRARAALRKDLSVHYAWEE